MRIPPPPPGFDEVSAPGGGAVGFARPGAAATVAAALARHGTLHAASAGWSSPVPLAGRGRLVAAVPPGRDPARAEAPRWVVRPYLRGGWMAPLLGDRHLAAGTPRPWAEARAAAALETAGVPTARVVAGIVYPGWPWYRAELVTAWLAGTADLADLLFGPDRISDGADRRRLLEAAGRIPAALGRAGVLHRDLNAKNLLAGRLWVGAGPSQDDRPDGDGQGVGPAPRLHVIDLDRARVGPVDSADVRAMSTRLARSLRKFGDRRGPPLSETEWAAFCSPPPAAGLPHP